MTTETTNNNMSPEQQERIRKAKARMEAARLRVLAVQQDDVGGYERTAAQHPERADVCLHKAEMGRSFAAETRAKADLIEAEAGI